MSETELMSRITARPVVLGGKPIVGNMRISVESILSLLAQEESWDAILEDYPDLERDDIRACIAFATFGGSTKSAPPRDSEPCI